MEANNQTSLGFCRSNNTPHQSCLAPGSTHNQVSRHQSCQQENGVKRSRKEELQLCQGPTVLGTLLVASGWGFGASSE
ncbi:hypothetical protein DSO57_1014464 [Entomophthora muscae]|uniref:Uncharacterized protein n=1 Tax=Entomophthora muscae TaxID=34485 RepID=A0ACC2RWK6_9FUNG|nr:hypothetical protein DSO57_1014464 [Entomophthora muscae]